MIYTTCETHPGEKSQSILFQDEAVGLVCFNIFNSLINNDGALIIIALLIVYSSDRCPYCVKAKTLFERKGVSFEEINVTDDDKARQALVEKSGGLRTVPQIFINDAHIGGCDDLYALDNKGELDPLLQS